MESSICEGWSSISLKKQFSEKEIRFIGGGGVRAPCHTFGYYQVQYRWIILLFSCNCNCWNALMIWWFFFTASIMLALWRVNLSFSTNIGFSKLTRFPFRGGDLTKMITDFLFWESLKFLLSFQKRMPDDSQMQTILKTTLSSIQHGETILRSQSAVAFIKMLLLIAGIESNPGPLGGTNPEMPESSGNLFPLVLLRNTYSQCGGHTELQC